MKESSFFHPDLRRIAPEENSSEGLKELKDSFLGQWLRVTLRDDRVFVGTLKAIDNQKNLVLLNPLEVRPQKEKEAEVKSHRTVVFIKGVDIVKMGMRKDEEKEK